MRIIPGVDLAMSRANPTRHTATNLSRISSMSGLCLYWHRYKLARHACDREMKGQLVLALCTSLFLVSGALEHRLHARETDEASGGGKTLTHSQSLS